MASSITIVVIGAAVAGIKVSHGVLKQVPTAKVILVNSHKDYYFNIATPRVMAKPDAFSANQYLYPITDIFKKYSKESFEFVQGTATEIDADSKTIKIEKSAKSSVSYDYLVIASGSTTHAAIGQDSALVPFKSTNSVDLPAAIDTAQKAIGNAKSIIIGGAGAVGVEFAGELAEAFASKKEKSTITLVSASDHVLPKLKKQAGAAAENLLKSNGVKLIPSKKVEKAELDQSSQQWTVTLDGGEKLTADLYVSATGVIPNNNFIPPVFLNKEGWLDVDDQMRVKAAVTGKGKCSIYGIGDITSYPYRDGYRISDQAPIVVSNLKEEITGKGTRATYAPKDKTMAIVPVGKSGGTGQIGGWVPWSFLVAYVKGRDFLVSRASSFIQG